VISSEGGAGEYGLCDVAEGGDDAGAVVGAGYQDYVGGIGIAQARQPRSSGRRAYGRHMRLSTRNQLDGTVVSVTRGEAMAVVRVRLAGGDEITSSITRDAVDDLGLAEGSAVTVLIKSTEVTLGVE